MYMKKIFYIVLFSIGVQNSFSQDTLKLSDAVDLALEGNFGLKVAQKQVDLAQNQIFKGNAGMSPVVDWNANIGSNFNQVHQDFVDGRVIDRFGTAYSPGTNVSLQYTLYNGQRMQAIFERLKALGQLSEVQQLVALQNTISNLNETYYAAQRLQTTLEFINEIIKYYEERLKITEERWQIGRGSKLDYLQSKADLTIQLTDQTNTEIQLRNAKIALNRIFARDPHIDFAVEKSEESFPTFDLNYLLDQARSQNPEFLTLKKQEDINLIQQKEAKSFRKPTVNLNSNFGYTFSANNAGLITSNQTIGLTAGVTASWRIADGGLIKRNIQTTKINADIIRLQKDDMLNTLDNQITAAYYEYETSKRLLALEQQNIETAQENLDISAEKFKLGASTILEINDAQTRFNTIMNRFVNAQFNLRVASLNLLTLSGELVKKN